MSMWAKSHLPDSFVAVFHTPFTKGPGRFAIATSYDEKDVRREGKRFNAFKASLRRNPSHPTAKRYAKMDTRLEYRCGEDGLWEALVTTRWSLGIADMIAENLFGEDMQKAIDTLRNDP